MRTSCPHQVPAQQHPPMRANASQMTAFASLSALVNGDSSALCSTFQDSACAHTGATQGKTKSRVEQAAASGRNQVPLLAPPPERGWLSSAVPLPCMVKALLVRLPLLPGCLKGPGARRSHLGVVNLQDRLARLFGDDDQILAVHPLREIYRQAHPGSCSAPAMGGQFKVVVEGTC